MDVLLIEDNPGDARLAELAFQESPLKSHLHWVEDGSAGLAFLRCQAPFGDAPRPDLILLDLNLPGRSGHDVLVEIRQDRQLGRIPLVMMSTSTSSEDVTRAYDLGANSYVAKPLELDDFIASIRQLEQYWFGVVTLPANDLAADGKATR